MSPKADLKFGVPPGSALGPLVFTLYTTPLSSMISGHTIPHHLYADDSQLHVSFASGDSTAALNGLQSYLASVQSWMSKNTLKLNPDKTEFLLIGNEQQWSKYLSMFPIELFSAKTNPTKSARNVRVILYNNFAFHSHISAVCSSCFHHVRNLRHIRQYLDVDGAKILATALVSSCRDYCRSLLHGIADTDLTKLQCVQNQLARIVTKSPSFACSVSLLRFLYWLQVKFRILFKINLLTNKTLREKQPVDLHSMLAPSLPSRSLRSSKELVCWSLGSWPPQVQELLHYTCDL